MDIITNACSVRRIVIGSEDRDVFALSGSGIPKKAQFLVAAWSGKTGKMLDGMPSPIEDFQFLERLFGAARTELGRGADLL